MFFNAEWKKIEEDELKEKDEGKVFVFGASKRNRYLSNLFCQDIVDGMFDNNDELWGQKISGVEVCEPRYVEKAVIVTAVKDYVRVVRQLENLGYAGASIVIYIEDSIYVNRMSRYMASFKEKDFLLLEMKNYKYIHVIIDQKFVLPTIYSVEKYFNMKEHFFIIYAVGEENENDIYSNWERCKEFRLRYKNIYFVDDYYNKYFIDWKRKLHELDDIVKESEKIIFHGEWLRDAIVDYFAEQKEMLNKKAIWIVWSGNAGKDAANVPYIEKMLRYVGGVVNKSNNIFENIDKNCNMVSYKKIYSDFNYTWSTDENSVKKKKKNVLIGHSCYDRNNNLEGLEFLKKFAGEIDVYCITSYGNNETIQKVKERGMKWYGEHFHAIDKYMEYRDYVAFLANMDVAFFCEDTGAGVDTLQILFLTKTKVYLKRNSAAEEMMRAYGYITNICEDVLKENLTEFFDDKWVSYNYEESKKKFDDSFIKMGWEQVLYADLQE